MDLRFREMRTASFYQHRQHIDNLLIIAANLVRIISGGASDMNDQHEDERRSADAVAGRAPEAPDRWEDEGGGGREDTRTRRRNEPSSPAREVAEPQELASMIADPNRVVVTTGSVAHVVQVHHQDIPELNADGESPESAAANLAHDLAREIEGAADDLLREAFQRALADVRAFIEASTLSRANQHVIIAGIINCKMTDALRRPHRSPGGDRGGMPRQQHETGAEQTREAQEYGEARGAVESSRNRMVDIGRGNQQAGRQGQ